MTRTWYRIILIRICMASFWIIALLIFLQLPQFITMLYPQKSITIFTWPRILDVNYLQEFEKKPASLYTLIITKVMKNY